MATSTVEQYPPLLSLAVHEFRTPLSVVVGYLRMLQRDPDNTSWLRELAVSHTNFGDIYQAQERLADALREYMADLAIAKRLCDLDPSNKRWQDDLRVAMDSIEKLRKHPDFPFKQIVQCGRTPWPFPRTASAAVSFVWQDGEWRSLQANPLIGEVNGRTLKMLAQVKVEMPPFLARHAGQLRPRRRWDAE